MKIVLLTRPDISTRWGDDSTVVEGLIPEYQRLGHNVVVDSPGASFTESPDVVHVLTDELKASEITDVLLKTQTQTKIFFSPLTCSESTIAELTNSAATLAARNCFIVVGAQKLREVLLQRGFARERLFVTRLGCASLTPADDGTVSSQFNGTPYLLLVTGGRNGSQVEPLLHACSTLKVPVVLLGAKRSDVFLSLEQYSLNQLISAVCGARAVAQCADATGISSAIMLAAGKGKNITVPNDIDAPYYLGSAAHQYNRDDAQSLQQALSASIFGPRSQALRLKALEFSLEHTTRHLDCIYATVQINEQSNATLQPLQSLRSQVEQVSIPAQSTQDSRSVAELITEAKERYAAKDLELAHRLVGKAQEKEPGNPALHRLRAEFYLTQRQCAEARQQVARALAINNSDARSHQILGLSFQMQGDYAASYEPLLRAATMEPDSELIVRQFAEAALATKKFTDLRWSLERLISTPKAPPDLVRLHKQITNQ